MCFLHVTGSFNMPINYSMQINWLDIVDIESLLI
jgi:hypothetical protein